MLLCTFYSGDFDIKAKSCTANYIDITQNLYVYVDWFVIYPIKTLNFKL